MISLTILYDGLLLISTDSFIISCLYSAKSVTPYSMVIKIYAKSTSPYVKTISAKFEYIAGKKGLTYEIEDEKNRTYLVFKITNAQDTYKVITAGTYAE